jgi:hypothetical protein
MDPLEVAQYHSSHLQLTPQQEPFYSEGAARQNEAPGEEAGLVDEKATFRCQVAPLVLWTEYVLEVVVYFVLVLLEKGAKCAQKTDEAYCQVDQTPKRRP